MTSRLTLLFHSFSATVGCVPKGTFQSSRCLYLSQKLEKATDAPTQGRVPFSILLKMHRGSLSVMTRENRLGKPRAGCTFTALNTLPPVSEDSHTSGPASRQHKPRRQPGKPSNYTQGPGTTPPRAATPLEQEVMLGKQNRWAGLLSADGKVC